FSIEQMIEWFSLEGLNKGAARFDFVKLENVNGHYIRESKPDYLYRVMVDTAQETGRDRDHAGLVANAARVLAALPALPAGATTVLGLIDLAQSIYAIGATQIHGAAGEAPSADARSM